VKIIALLTGIHAELRKLNENLESLAVFNESPLAISKGISLFKQIAEAGEAYENEKLRLARLNPLKEMTVAEVLKLKSWIRSQLEKKNVSIRSVAGESYSSHAVTRFLDSDTKHSTAIARDMVAAALGYDTFCDLVEAYRQEGGVA
jgi:lambda repressor-like predicted transcriptional regulator